MQKSQTCLGCRTVFEEGSRLPGQDLTIQLKNYSYPIKDQKHRWILLKTIVSLLNSKGGTIFIGAEDKTGEVVGIQVSRKEQDQYKLFVQALAERIQPPVDLSNREDIIMQFVPVVREGNFTGRYLGKIIVKQGDPAKLYCFTQKVVIQSVIDKKYDDFDVVYSYKRINLGSVKQLSGYDVVAEATSRALNPPKTVNIFHDGCNPEPKRFPDKVGSTHDIQFQSSPKSRPKTPSQQMKQVQLQPKNSQQETEGYVIQFFKVKQRKMRQKLQDELDRIMDELKITNENISYDDENDTLVVDFDGSQQWTKAMDYIDANLDKINDHLQGYASFVKKQAEQDFAVYQNQKPEIVDERSGQLSQAKTQSFDEVRQKQQKPSAPKKQSAKEEEKQKSPKLDKRSQSLQKQIVENNNNLKTQQKTGQNSNEPEYEIKVISQRKQTSKELSSHQYINIPSSVDLQQKTTLTITRINPSRKAQLIEFIKQLTSDHKNVVQYDKTVEFVFDNKSSFDKLHDKLQKSKDLAKFGFKGVLRYGINTGQITLQDYDKKKYRQFKTYITKIVGDDAKRCEFFKKGDKYTLVLTLKSEQKAAKWLDKLIQDTQIKTFRIPGGNQAKKMKIDLVCVKPKKSKNQSNDQ